jgi:hypothetical protein
MRLKRDLGRRVIASEVVLGPKMHFPFLQRCIRGFVSFRAGGGLLWVVVLGFFLWFTVWLWLLVGFLGWVFLGFDF